MLLGNPEPTKTYKDGYNDRSRSHCIPHTIREEERWQVMSHIPYYGQDEKEEAAQAPSKQSK